ncbi:MAG TPA: DUF1289 domain-containing protein [Rhodanobacter sp.]|nr:DUF1289 domain-containing protein [Rhodanobacter sp.]
MSPETFPAPPTPSTPCIGVCRLGADGWCVGCRRSGDEIARWRTLAEPERLRIMRNVLPQRSR